MNAKTLPTPPGLRTGSSQSARMASGQDRRTPRTVPPIEQRFSPPPGVYRGADPLAMWPARPRISRNSSKRSQSPWTLTLAIGGIVFALGAIRVASHLGIEPHPIIIRLIWSA